MEKCVGTNNDPMPAVSLKNISKTYDDGKVKAVNDVSFEVEQGELFGLIGPDGAGKTSIFRYPYNGSFAGQRARGG